jgi:hypothetical protein
MNDEGQEPEVRSQKPVEESLNISPLNAISLKVIMLNATPSGFRLLTSGSCFHHA